MKSAQFFELGNWVCMDKPKTQDRDYQTDAVWKLTAHARQFCDSVIMIGSWNTFHPDLENLNGQNTQRHLAACIWKMRGFHWIRSRSGTWNFRKGSTSAHMRRVLVRHQQFHYQGKQDVHFCGIQQLRVYCCFEVIGFRKHVFKWTV